MRVALILFALAAPVFATPSQDLDYARAEFRAGHLKAAERAFNDLLYPPPPKLANNEELAEAYTNLGVCRAAAGDIEGAKREFEKALLLDPNRQIDPSVVTDRSVIRLFDDSKLELKTRVEREAARKQKQEDEERIQYLIQNTYTYQAHSYLLNFIPGFAQWQNGQTVKAVLFGSGELLTLGATVGIWYDLVNKYGLQCVNCIPVQDASTVRLMQQIEVGSGIAFLGLYVWSAIDAVRNYTPSIRQKADPEEVRKQLEFDKTHPKKKKKTSLLDHLSPIVTPSGVGIGLSWEN